MVLDVITLIIIGYGFYLGFSRGIIKTVFTVLSIMVGVMATVKFSTDTTKVLQSLFTTGSSLMPFLGILVTFLISMLIVRMIARTIEGVLESANVNFINKSLGGFIVGGLFMILFSWIVWFFNEAKMIDESTKQSSKTYVILETIPDRTGNIGNQIQPALMDFWHYLGDAFDMLDQAKDKSNFDDFLKKDDSSEPIIRDLDDDES